jgi:hypothetical protein
VAWSGGSRAAHPARVPALKDRLRRYDLFDAVGPERFFPTVGTAVDGYIEATGTTWVDWEERLRH